MALGDGIRRNIAHVDPAERAMLRDALIEMNHRFFPGTRTDSPVGGVTWWFKQDEIHQATHVHHGPEFLPWHREIVNRLEEMLRQINPQLSLHYWDWTQDPRSIPGANLGGGSTGNLDLFTPDFMGAKSGAIGEPWLSNGFYVPGATNYRSTDPFDSAHANPADPPREVTRIVAGVGSSPETTANDDVIVGTGDYASMRSEIGGLEAAHDRAHGYVNMGGRHISFRDPFVFLLHSNVDRLFAKWQTQPGHPERLEPTTVYGSESASPELNGTIAPWDGSTSTRPWAAPESQQVAKTYKHPSVVFPPCYDTNATAIPLIEVMNAGTPPVINFNDVPSGETAVRAAVFRVYGCGDVTIRVKAGADAAAPFSVLQPGSKTLTVHHGAHLYAEARFWVAYTAGAAGVPVTDGSITFECPENGKQFTFVLKANAINRPKVAVMLALDQSGSMDLAAGTSGALRINVLKDAARKFMELVQQNNGVGLIRFDHNSYPVNDATYPGLPVTRMLSNNMFDPGRVAAIAAVNAHNTNPAGNTSVGDGVNQARQVLNALPATDYDQKALVVLTDGLENDPLWIADVAGSIDNRTFAIGLGNESQVNTAALNALANNTGGYLLLTGLLSASIDDYFRLSKYFLQILAGVTNNNVILDPNGYVAPGITVRIPFQVNEADIDCTAMLMTDVNVVDMELEAPDGTRITSASAGGLGIDYGLGAQTRSYRFTLPAAIGSGQHAGTWYVVLEIDKDEYKKWVSKHRERLGQTPMFQSFLAHGARYCVAIHTYSNLKMAVRVEQDSYEPGGKLLFQTTLAEYELPVEKRAQVEVELTRPGGSVVTVPLAETEAGVFEGSTIAAFSGVYHARILAKGVTLRGTPFTREQLGTAAVWRGGDIPYQPPRDSGHDEWCRLLTCLLSEKNFDKEANQRLERAGINLDGIRRCVHSVCGKNTRGRLRG